jgi:Na+-driven multidrug efflux pump
MTIVLDLLLIPPYGGLGAAIASTASYLTGAVVIAVVFGRAFGSRALDLVPRRADAAWIVSKLRSRGAPPAEPGT